MEDIGKEFKAYFKETVTGVLVNESIDPRRVFFLRPSQLPFCGLRRLLDYASTGLGFLQDSKADKLYYTSVGSTTHSVFQRIVGRGGRIIGDWKCHACGFTRELSTYKVCDKCKTSMQYEEIEVAKRSWRGHLDNIYIAKNGEWWVIDYKTCKKDFIFKKQYGPSQAYKEQQNHYVVLLEEKLGRKIAGWILMYLARDNPMQLQRAVCKRITPEQKERFMADNHLYSKLHKHIFKVETVQDVKPLYQHKRCADRADHDRTFRFEPCKYVDVCFKGQQMVDTIKKIVNKSEHLPLIKYMPKEIKKELYEENG